EIKDNTVNFIAPYTTEEEKETILKCFQTVFDKYEMEKYSIFSLKHRLDGYFLVFQTVLT
ncbi:MAG: hypothetical protein LBG73_08270, partial [Spirochaetaceae bacterium]|nr:hypothetical protein [Spirochaetaceae bacterium]